MKKKWKPNGREGRASWKGSFGGEREQLYAKAVQESGPCRFVGYETETHDATLKAIVGPETLQDKAIAGQEVELQFEASPFYAESGGQVGDTGLVLSEDATLDEEQIRLVLDTRTLLEGVPGTVALVTDCLKPVDGAWLHKARVLQGSMETGKRYRLVVDHARRTSIRANHSVTHLLQRALRLTLGEHVKQAGRLRRTGSACVSTSTISKA